jgi:hypothetical protein
LEQLLVQLLVLALRLAELASVQEQLVSASAH